MPVKIELFNSLRSFTKVLNPALVQGNYAMKPLTGGNGVQGILSTAAINAAGAGGVNGVRFMLLTGGSGSGGGILGTVVGGILTGFTIVNRGQNFKAGDILNVNDASLIGATLTVTAIINNIGTAGFSEDGSLQIIGDTGDRIINVNSNDVPYRSLIEETLFKPLQVRAIRMTTATDAQINNDITITHLLSNGQTVNNVISPRTYFNPSQFQSRILDIPFNVKLDGHTGLLYTVNDFENIRMIFLLRDGENIGINITS